MPIKIIGRHDFLFSSFAASILRLWRAPSLRGCMCKDSGDSRLQTSDGQNLDRISSIAAKYIICGAL